MHILKRKWWFLASIAALFMACTTDSPVQVITPSGQIYDEEEYESLVSQGLVDDQGNVVEEPVQGTEEGSSKSKSSSSVKAGSSSSAKVTSSAGTSSSSSAKASSSSSAPASSSAVAGVESVVDGDNYSVGTNDMENVAESTKTELDSLKEVLDNGGSSDGFESLGTEFDETTMTYASFDEGDYYCFTGEGEWMHISRDLLGQFIPHYKNGAAWGNLRHFEVKFLDACEDVYFRRK